jgi:uroporphyrin-III C-methyltransferase/precorrin-2 dehydrogenase/sirohydrochlorin ferrochelatase
LVAGAGRVAARRIQRLLAAGAEITVVAPRAVEPVRALAASGRIRWHQQTIATTGVSGYFLVIAATDDAQANADLARAARAVGIPVQRVDAAADSDFLLPAIVERGALQIAISSDGYAPVLSRRLRAQLETWLPPAYGDLIDLAARFRARVKQALPVAERRHFWRRVFDGPIAEKVFAGRPDEAAADLEVALAGAGAGRAADAGEVYLVGAGPGDPDLLTFRALRLMQRADVVLYDSLVAPAIVALAAPEAKRIHVGKRAARPTASQPDINTLMIDYARAGHRVLRLKGGDPFVFGRGGEEIAELAAANVAFQIVPGITAANGCAAYAGIPLTHRDYAQSVIFVTGHARAGELKLSWPELARPGQTVVFFMARRNLPVICAALRAHGLAAGTPAALVIEGTTARQRLLVGTLADLPEKVAQQAIAGPALLIVGEVVRLNETLGWFRPADDPCRV